MCALNCETGQMEEHKCDSNMGIKAEGKACSYKEPTTIPQN